MAKKLTSTKARKILHDKEVHGHPLTEQQRKFFGAIAGGAKPYKAESGGWLDKYEEGGVLKQKTHDNYGTKPNANDSDVSLPPGFVGMAYNTKGRNYSPAWGGQFQMGGSLPGAVGFTYARTAGAAPANGPYAKKTKASAQNGQEMKFYQAGLDFKPKTISQDGSDIPVDPMGYWNPENVGSPVIIPSNVITMEGVDQPLLGISDTGDVQYMEPGEDYEFDGEYVTEYPVAQKGKTIPAPTTADSARLYNAQVALNKFYDNEVKAGRLEKRLETDFSSFTPVPLRQANLDFYRGEIKQRSEIGGERFTDQFYKQYFNLSPEQVKQLEYKGLAQTKGASEYQDYYRDIITPLQNLASPLALLDYRIRPQREIVYSPILAGYPGGYVQVYDYDPLAVKPYNMRTPQEKIEWEKKYGKKETTKAKPTPPPAKKKMVASTPETVRQTIPPAAIPSSTSSTKSVSEKVGMLDMFGKKDVELLVDNFGNYEWFRKDDDIGDLKPIRRATREEIEYSKKQKQRNGGVNKADEYSIEKLDQLLNFTNYNKPTKGGWLDKYN